MLYRNHDEYDQIILDINYEINLLENIYLDKIGVKMYQLESGLIYLPNERFPVSLAEGVKKYGDEYVFKYQRQQPYHPYICLPPLKDYVLNELHGSYKNKKIYIKNNLLPVSKQFYYDNYVLADEFIRDEFLEYFIENDCVKIRDISDTVLGKVLKCTDKYKYRVFDINIDYSIIRLLIMEEIGTFRYYEAYETLKERND